MMKSLAYHCYPLASNGVWRWNLAQLRQRWSLFDGRRVIAVAIDAETVPAQEVQDEMAGLEVEWIIGRNNHKLGEVASWVSLWSRIEELPGVTFRAHTKGVTNHHRKFEIQMGSRPDGKGGREEYVRGMDWTAIPAPPDRCQTMRLWADLLYRANLDHWPKVEALLERHPIAGAFKQHDNPTEPLGRFWPPWHYLGSFYWTRNADFFTRDWRGIQPFFYGTETWPGFHYDTSEASCVFGEMPARQEINALGFWQEMGRQFVAWEGKS